MPRFAQLNPHDQDPERAQLVQAYMVLHAKQTSVRRRLSTSLAMSPVSSIPSSPDRSPSRSPDSNPQTPLRRSSAATFSHGLPQSSSPIRSSRSPFLRRPSVPSIPEHPEAERELDSDQEKLFDINCRIKATLTDLLNCSSVKHDDRMRSWVQTRLLDAQTTTSDRRRSSSGMTPSYHRRSSSSTTISSQTLQAWPTMQTSSYSGRFRTDDYMGDEPRKMSI